MAQTTENTISGSYIIPLKANEISDRLLKVPSLNIFCYTENKCYLDTENPHNIVVEIEHRIYDGMEIKFKAPEACSEVAGLTVHATFYETGGAKANTYSYFEFVDAYGNKAEDVFKKDAIVKVVLTDLQANADGKVVGNARILNAHTNSYLEGKFKSVDTRITEFDTRIDEFDKSIADLNTSIDTAKSDLGTAISTAKNELNAAIEEAVSEVSENTESVNNVISDLKGIDTRVSAVESSIKVTNANIDGLETAIDTRVSAVETKVDNAIVLSEGLHTSVDDHTKNKNNPHDVYADQIGAVPIDRTINGKVLSDNITLSATDVSAVPVSRTINGKALSSNIALSAADVDAAPAGYGLGILGAVYTSDLNTCIQNGWYYTSSATLNIPHTYFSEASVFVMGRTSTYIVQKITSIYARSIMMRYTSDGGATWVEEWVEPPMMTDVEYRTTERVNGKAVYKKKESNGAILYRLDGESEWHNSTPYILTENEYGTSYPFNPIVGQLFFKKVVS